MRSCRSLRDVSIDTLMLDTTYSTPKWSFPDQAGAVQLAVEIIRKARDDNSSMFIDTAAAVYRFSHRGPIVYQWPTGTVFVFNAYHIGKERCYFKAAIACNFSVWVSPRRMRTLERLQLPREWMNKLTNTKSKADIVVCDQGVGPEQLQSVAIELRRPVIGFQCSGMDWLTTCQLCSHLSSWCRCPYSDSLHQTLLIYTSTCCRLGV